MHGAARVIRIPDAGKHDGIREERGRELQPFQKQAERGMMCVWCVTLHHLVCMTVFMLTLAEWMQDAAKKALEEMFGGKEDLLAAYDAGGGNSGKVCTCDGENFALHGQTWRP